MLLSKAQLPCTAAAPVHALLRGSFLTPPAPLQLCVCFCKAILRHPLISLGIDPRADHLLGMAVRTSVPDWLLDSPTSTRLHWPPVSWRHPFIFAPALASHP